MNTDPIFRSYHISYANQYGGDLPYFVGKQYGSGWLRTLAKVAFPIVKRVVGTAGKVAKDVIVKEKPLGQSIRKRAIEAVGKVISSNNNNNNTPINNTNYPLYEKQAKRRKKK